MGGDAECVGEYLGVPVRTFIPKRRLLSNVIYITCLIVSLLSMGIVSAPSSAVSKVKFLEASLEQAKHAESGRNALVKQITILEEEIRHSQHRLDICRAEAMVSTVPRIF